MVRVIIENKSKKSIFILVGPPSVGKSTWIKNTFGDISPYIISRDDTAEAVAEQLGLTYDDMFVLPPEGSKIGDIDPKYGTVVQSPDSMKWSPTQYDKVVKANEKINGWLYKKIKQADASGKDIVVDMTNMTIRARKRALEAIEGKESEYKKVAVVFETSGAEDIVAKNAARRSEITKAAGRPKTVPPEQVYKMLATFQAIASEEGFDEVVSVDNRAELKKIVNDWENEKMKITESQLRTAIKESIEEAVIVEELGDDDAELEDGTPVCEACLYEELTCGCPDLLEEGKYHGKTVPLGKPMRGDVKKFKVYVRDPKTGNVKKVNFGDKNMRIKKSNPKRRKSFRARHNCANPGPRTKARYWSCRKW